MITLVESLEQSMEAARRKAIKDARKSAKERKLRVAKAMEMLAAWEPHMKPLLEFAAANDIAVEPRYSIGDIYIDLPWQLPLLQVMEECFCAFPEDLFSKTPMDHITEEATMGYYFGWKADSWHTVRIKCDAKLEGSTCRLEKTEEIREVTTTKKDKVVVYDVICNGVKSGEHFKPVEES